MKTLVIVYSRTGTTRKVGTEIARACNADLLEVEDVRSRRGALGAFRSVLEALTGRFPPIKPTSIDPAAYDLVVLGAPVWAGRVAAPMQSFLAQKWDRIGRLAAFCTLGGSGAERALQQMADTVGLPAVAALALLQREVDSGAADGKIREFIDRLGTLPNAKGRLVPFIPPVGAAYRAGNERSAP